METFHSHRRERKEIYWPQSQRTPFFLDRTDEPINYENLVSLWSKKKRIHILKLINSKNIKVFFWQTKLKISITELFCPFVLSQWRFMRSLLVHIIEYPRQRRMWCLWRTSFNSQEVLYYDVRYFSIFTVRIFSFSSSVFTS